MSAARRETPRQRPASSSGISGTGRLTPSVERLNVGEPQPAQPAPPVDSQTPAVTEPVPVRRRGRRREPAPELPRYLTLVRKELRLREDQADALAALRRRVAANRTDKTETITDNTLVRVAVDLLLSRAAYLIGDTEDELTRNVIRGRRTHRATDSQSPGTDETAG